MLKLLRDYLAPYHADTNAIVAPAIFLLVLLIIRFVMMSLATSELKNLPSDVRKQLRKHYRSRSFVGWMLFIGAWSVLILGYFEMMPKPFNEDVYVFPAAGLLILLTGTAHYLAYAQASIQTLVERKSLSIVG